VAEFAKTVSRGFVRNARSGEIGDVLGRFGDNCKARFQSVIGRSIGEAGLNRIGNLVRNRDSFAHLDPPDVTFGELETAFSDVLKMVDAVAQALGLED
jgi:hypothetical protein